LCANKLYINPDHLEFGSASDNQIDNVKHNGGRKFKKSDILEIRKKSSDGFSNYKLGKELLTSIIQRRNILKKLLIVNIGNIYLMKMV
jgi:hypothetical protein